MEAALAAMFLGAGVIKLVGVPEVVAFFQAAGFGRGFRDLVGTTEVLGALLLLTPRLAGVGALVLAGVMVGAAVVDAVALRTSPLIPATVLVVLLVLAWVRRANAIAVLGATRAALARRLARRHEYTHL